MRQRRPAIVQLEIRMHIPNFINSGIDYDPGFSVLFEGSGTEGGNGGGCGAASNEYSVINDWVFWESVSAFIVAVIIILVVVLFVSTPKGFEIVRGRKTVRAMRRTLRKHTSSGEFHLTNGSLTPEELIPTL